MGSRYTSSTIAAFTLALALPVGPAMALGFGEVRAQPLLGQPLNLALPVTLGEGETLSSECAGAEVVAGDTQVQPINVRVRVTQGRGPGEAVLRISTTVPIDEPVLSVTVSAGCPARMTRTLVLLADPPLVDTAVPTVVAASDIGSRSPASSAIPTPTAASGSAEAAPAPPRATRPATPPRAARTAAPRTTTTAAPSVVADSAPPPAPAVQARAPAVAAARPAAPVAGRPRLQLDGGQVGTAPGAAALAAADLQLAAARSAASAAEAAASAAEQRAQALEAEMVQLRAAAKAQTAALDALRAQIASDQAQRQQQGWLIPLLLGALALLAGLAVWLALRLREQRPAGRTSAWWDKAGASVPAAPYGSEPSEYGTSSLFKPSASAPLKPATAPAPLASHEPSGYGGLDSLIAPPTVPAPVPPPPAAPPSPARDAVAESQRPVSVDEQIDLEQQADFFIALGHEESAIDLLMAHLRSTGGGTPLPFLKLLEIHRRRGDREAYERTRVRFNQRFNSVAPDWHADPKSGRSLDAYPLVVGRIQHAWSRPLDSMAELEALLFRRGEGSEMFDLPAYQEVLFLYQLARDLQEAEQPDRASDVDVLLPIGGAAAAGATAGEGSIVLLPEFNAGRAVTLDLDLTGAASRPADLAPVTPAATAEPEGEFVLDLEGDAGDSRGAADDAWSTDLGDKRRDA